MVGVVWKSGNRASESDVVPRGWRIDVIHLLCKVRLKKREGKNCRNSGLLSVVENLFRVVVNKLRRVAKGIIVGDRGTCRSGRRGMGLIFSFKKWGRLQTLLNCISSMYINNLTFVE